MRSIRLVYTLGAMLLFACEAKVQRVPISEVLLRIESEAAVRDIVKQLRVRTAVLQTEDARWVERPALSVPVESKAELWPVDIPVVPREPARLPALFEVVVEALDDGGQVLVQERALTSFSKDSVRVLTLTLTRCGEAPLRELCETKPTCHGMKCQRCAPDGCADTSVTRPASLPQLDPNAAIDSPDASVEDSGSDSGPSPAPDGGVDAAVGGSGGTNAGGAGGHSGGGEGGAGRPVPQAGASGGPPPPIPEDTWSDPERVNDAAQDVYGPTSANNPAGEVIIAWWQQTTPYIRRFVSGKWDTAPVPLPGMAPALDARSGFALGIDNSGAAQLLYTDGEPKTRWLRWTGETSLGEAPEPNALGDQKLAELSYLSVTEAGLATAIWCGEVAAGKHPCYFNRLGTTGWASPTLLGMTGATVNTVGLAENGTGDFVALFRSGAQGGSSDTLQSFIGKGATVTELSPFALTEPATSNGYAVALDSQGNAIALVMDAAASPTVRLAWTRYAAGSNAWSPPVVLTQQAEIASIRIIAPPRAPATVALWFEYTVPGARLGRLMARRYGATGWGEAKQVSGEYTWEEAESSAEIGGNFKGELVVAWNEKSGSGSTVLRYERFAVASGWSAPRSIATLGADASLVSVNVGGDGRALVLWTQVNMNKNTLYWSRSLSQ